MAFDVFSSSQASTVAEISEACTLEIPKFLEVKPMLPKNELKAHLEQSEEAQVAAALDFDYILPGVKPKVLLNHLAWTKGGSIMVAVDDIHVLDGLNLRIKNEAYYAHIRALADSMKLEGFYLDKPIACFAGTINKKPVLHPSDGHCRYAAVLLAISEGAPIAELPIVIKDVSTTMEDIIVSMVRTAEGKKLTPIEIAIGCKRLLKFNWKPPQIAKKLGFTVEYVNQLLVLAGAPNAIREMVQSGNVTAATALDAIRKHGSDATEVMNGALAVAKANGKTKLTAKFLPSQVRKKAITRAAPAMLTIIERMAQQKAFASLDSDLRAMIKDILTLVPRKEDDSPA